MEFATKLFLFAMLCALAFSVSASPMPGNFFKDLEGIGQRVRDSIISARPAVDVIADATRIVRPDHA